MSDRDDCYPFLEGERLYLRVIRSSDVNDAYYPWMNDPETTQYLESRFFPNSKESLLEYVKSFQSGNQDSLFLAIVLKEKHRHIGNIKLGPINRSHRFAGVGILIGEKDCWGKGYASEAIALLAEYAFRTLTLHKLIAGCYEPNQGALKAFKKAGFQIEGVRKKHRFFNGKYVDNILLGRINPTEEEGS